MSIPPPVNPPHGDPERGRPGAPDGPPIPPPPSSPVFPPPPTGPGVPASGPPPSFPAPPRRPGRLLGALAAIGFWVVATLLWFRFGGDQLLTGLVLTLGASVLAATAALASERFRPYATGFLIASGVLPIVLGGACIGLIAVVTGSH